MRTTYTSRVVVGAALAAFVLSAAVGLSVGVREPSIHDEFAYLLAADTFASGRLANPPHPSWHHFETFHVVQQPSYASKYPAGQGLVLALGQVLVHPVLGVWLGVAFLAGALAWLLSVWVPRAWVGVGVALALLQFAGAGYWSQSYWGGSLAAAGGALVWAAARSWCERGALRDVALLTVGLVVLALTRPLEGAVAASIPLCAVAVSLARGDDRKPRIRRFVCVSFPILTALVLFMGHYNARVTGDPLRLPYQHHTELYSPVPLWTFGTVRSAPAYRHAELRRFHLEFEGSWLDADGSVAVARLARGKLQRMGSFYLGIPGILALLALPWVLREPWNRRALLGVLSVVVVTVLLATYGGMAHHVAPIAAPLLVLQVECLRRFARLRWRDRRVGLLVVALVLLGRADGSLARLLRHAPPDGHWSQKRAEMIDRLEAQPGPDLVLVRYGPRHNLHQEWVYNAARMEAAGVVWARAMDAEKDARLLGAFPGRRAWRLYVDAPSGSPRLEPYDR